LIRKTRERDTNGATRPTSNARPHPLPEALARISQLSGGYLQSQLGGIDEDWVRVRDLLDDPGETVARQLARIGEQLETRDLPVVSTFFLRAYAYQLIGTGAGGLLALKRAPNLAAANTALHFDQHGYVDRIAFKRGTSLRGRRIGESFKRPTRLV
jgi:hypothetical protein